MSETHRFYTDLAPWWPLISPVDEYVEEAGFVRMLLESSPLPVREVLELGSGGGHNALHLRERFELVLVDLSPQMLEVSRALNPECAHHRGDMRTFRLDRTFDAVFVHDAIMYMTTEDDLRAALVTAAVHLRPGGLLVVVPDETRETFEEDTSCGGSDAPDGRGARYLEWTWDPDPDDDRVSTSYTLVLRSADGAMQTVSETHQTGLFAIDTWVRLLREVGFDPEVVTEVTEDDRPPRTIFLGHRLAP